ncbi:MAG: hypothetical protein ABIG42_07165 [bacterium]
MTDNKNKKEKQDDSLNQLFSAASGEDWLPRDGFSDRVLARIENEDSMAFTLDRFALRFLPFSLAASVAVLAITLIGDSLETMIFSTLSDPFGIESIIALLTG